MQHSMDFAVLENSDKEDAIGRMSVLDDEARSGPEDLA
jgi:hypothetical protein